MIVELIALNSAFKVIKTTLSNGKEILDAGKSIGKFLGAEREVKKKLDAGQLSVADAFKAKNDMAKAEEELKFMLNKQSLLGYHNWIQFKAQYYRDQREAEKLASIRAARRRKAIDANISAAFKALVLVIVISAACFGVAVYLK